MDDSYPILSLNTLAAREAARIQAQMTHAAIQAFNTPHVSRGISLVLLHDRVVGRLSDKLAIELGITSSARDVRLAASTQRHILHRREIAREDDVSHCLDRISEALCNIRFVRQPQPSSPSWGLIGLVPTTGRHVLLALKLVKAETAMSKVDELWLRTVHPLGSGTLRRYRARGELRGITAVKPSHEAGGAALATPAGSG